MSAYEALSFIPAYNVRANRTPPTRFIVILNNHRLVGFEALKVDFENRGMWGTPKLVTETQTVDSSGAVEVVVTTIG